MASLFFDEIRARRQHHEERHSIRQHRLQIILDDTDFKMNFRVSKRNFEELLIELGPHLKHGFTRYAIPVEIKLLSVLRFLAQGSYQQNVSNESFSSISKSTFSNILHEVVDVMNAVLCPNYIKFSNELEMNGTMTRVKEAFRLPGVVGFIDCTHVRIVGPYGREFPEFVYVNRKNYHSINVQIICDHQYRILNVNAKFPGSTNDSFIWRQSQIRNNLLMSYGNNAVWLLGDAGYPLEPNLIVPFQNPPNLGANLFNRKHRLARCTVERCIGVLKTRWRCLRTERGLHYKPLMASKIINACVALHNICLLRDADYYINDIVIQEEVEFENVRDHQIENLFTRGRDNRKFIIDYLLRHAIPQDYIDVVDY